MVQLKTSNSTMTKNDIITSIYCKNYPEKAWKKPKDSAFEDYKMEMYLILLEIPEAKLFKLYEAKELDDYFFSICRYQAAPTSQFHKMLFGKLKTQPLANYYKDDNSD